MVMADVFDELDSLLDQYWRAKRLGEDARAKVIYEKIVEEAKKHHIPIKADNPNKVIEEIHRYVDMVRNTQINVGLHIFGNPPDNASRIAEYVATMMAFDTYRYPSMYRVLCEILGLNYEDVRRKPDEINDLGITNKELLKILRNLSINIFKRFIEEEIDQFRVSEDVLIGILRDEIDLILKEENTR